MFRSISRYEYGNCRLMMSDGKELLRQLDFARDDTWKCLGIVSKTKHVHDPKTFAITCQFLDFGATLLTRYTHTSDYVFHLS